jgi:hypothetical protein
VSAGAGAVAVAARPGASAQSHYWAKATLDGNRLQGNARGTGSFLHARLVQSD